MTVYDNIQGPKLLFETTSELSGHIEVIETGKTTKLRVNGVDQSLNYDSPLCDDLVWGKLVNILQKEEPGLKNVLILGMGGGTMASLISKVFDKPEIVSVEFDPVIVETAKKYFGADKIPNHRIITEDALKVVVEPEEHGLSLCSFQALIVDIYCGDVYPDLGKSGNFISTLKKMVGSGGLVIFNRLYTEEHQDEVNTFIDYIEGFFTDVKSEVVAGYTNSDNVVIYGRV